MFQIISFRLPLFSGFVYTLCVCVWCMCFSFEFSSIFFFFCYISFTISYNRFLKRVCNACMGRDVCMYMGIKLCRHFVVIICDAILLKVFPMCMRPKLLLICVNFCVVNAILDGKLALQKVCVYYSLVYFLLMYFKKIGKRIVLHFF